MRPSASALLWAALSVRRAGRFVVRFTALRVVFLAVRRVVLFAVLRALFFVALRVVLLAGGILIPIPFHPVDLQRTMDKLATVLAQELPGECEAS